MNKPEYCKKCPLYSAPGPVPGEGDLERALFGYIAQNPTYVEVKCGRPLMGSAGKLFNSQLLKAGVPRELVYITNQVKCETPNNRVPTSEEIKYCSRFIDTELKRLRSDTVVLADQVAFDAHIGRYSTIGPFFRPTNSISQRMGFVEQRNGKKWIGTLHPSTVLRQMSGTEIKGVVTDPWVAIQHLKKAASISGKQIPLLDHKIYPTDEIVMEWAKRAKEVGEFADDFETIDTHQADEDDYVGGSSKPTMLGLSCDPYKAILIKPEQIHLLEELLGEKDVFRYEHNGAFDDYYLAQFASERNNKEFDTLTAAHTFKSHIPKKLKPHVASLYTNLPYWDRTLSRINEPLYCCYDAAGTLLAAKELRSLLDGWKLTQFHYKYCQPMPKILDEWRVRGINTDVRQAILMRQWLLQNMKRGELLVSKIVGPLFNPKSHDQVKDLLYNVWKLPEQTRKKKNKATGKMSTIVTTDADAKKALIRWIDSNPDRKESYKVARTFLLLLDYIAGEKAKLDVLGRIDPDGKIHPFWMDFGASSFRIASSPNFQNWQKGDVGKWGTSSQSADEADPTGMDKVRLGSLRSLVIPDSPDDILFSCDYDQIELWVYAAQFNVQWLLEMYEKKEYIYGVIYEDVHKPELFFEPGKPKTKKFRLESIDDSKLKHVKAIPLGFLYGRNAEAVAKEYGWPLSEGVRLRRWWFGKNPELEAAYAKIEYQVTQNGYARHIFGSIVNFPRKKLTDAYNSFGQHPAAVILRGSIIEITKEFKRRGYQNTRILGSVHDQLLFNIPRKHAIEVYEEIIHPIMTRPIPELTCNGRYPEGFRFRISTDVGRNWDYKMEGYETWKQKYLNGGN